MKLVLDAGALIAVDRGDRRVLRALATALKSATALVTTAPVVGQVWRGGPRQARLARWLQRIGVRSVDVEEAKEAGCLLGRSRTSDVVDALVTRLVEPGDEVMTSDPDDLRRLARAHDVDVRVVTV